MFEYWGKRDPIGMYETWLESSGLDRATLEAVEAQVLAEIAAAEREALASREHRMPRPEDALEGVYAAD